MRGWNRARCVQLVCGRPWPSDGLPHPEEFSLGSPESCAAAHVMLDRRDRAYLRIIVDVPRPGGHTIGSYRDEDNDGRVVEVVFPKFGTEGVH